MSAALGDRVPDRVRLVRAILTAGPHEHLGLIRWAASALMTEYRADYSGLVGDCAALLAGTDGNRRGAALHVLTEAGPLTAPAADGMLAFVADHVQRGAPVHDPTTKWNFMPGGPWMDVWNVEPSIFVAQPAM